MATSVYSLLVSLALHAAALAYAVPSGGRDYDDTIPVTVLLVERQQWAGSDKSVRRVPIPGISPRPGHRIKSSPPAKISAKPRLSSTPIIPPADPIAPISGGEPAMTPARPSADDSRTNGAFAWDGKHEPGAETSATGTGSGEFLGSAALQDDDRPNGYASEPGNSAITMIQASYRETPRPDYPETARREGREGRVLLRVLVDEEGRSKRVEINISSGSEALDRAAVQAIKSWRFHPARWGDRRIESWIRIPIEFRLAEADPLSSGRGR